MSDALPTIRTTIRRTALAAVAVLAASTAVAQQLDVRTVAQKEESVAASDGTVETRLVAAETVIPGDKVVYTITFTNEGSDVADDVVVTNPIDGSLEYLEGSAFGAGMTIEFSVDGGQSFSAPGDLMVADESGNRPARPQDYTHVRWTLDGDLEPGATGVARFSATVK